MQVERIAHDDITLAFLVRAEISPDRTTFVTPPEANLQLGFVIYPRDAEIQRHLHLPLERHLVGTAEVLVVRSGSCDVDLYSNDRELVASRELRTGDVLLVLAGGHGFRMREDTVLLEVKQGPYTGLAEKERF